MAVHFFFADSTITLKQRNRLKQFIEEVFKKEGKRLSCLNYIFCSDKYLLNINRQYLNHDYYTDIITFDISGKGEPLSGEIYISADRVKDNAAQLRTTISNEIHRVIFHGVLHLCGYKDKTRVQQKQMRLKENQYLMKYFE